MVNSNFNRILRHLRWSWKEEVNTPSNDTIARRLNIPKPLVASAIAKMKLQQRITVTGSRHTRTIKPTTKWNPLAH
jgi:hypothetical protein